MTLKIDEHTISVPLGTTVMKAAAIAGVEIPSMCFREGFHNHPSCMICMVKDAKTGNLFPSCAVEAIDGMEIITTDNEIREMRKEALELLMSDHVGDCEGPCRLGCPAVMNIPLMNRLISNGNFSDAIKIVKEDIALPLILGYICPAPCEKVCKRSQIDSPVSICQLKKFVAAEDLTGKNPWFPQKENPTGKKIAIIGSGPAGLTCAFYLTLKGHQCVIFEKENVAGGTLRIIGEERLPHHIIHAEIDYLTKFGVHFQLNKTITTEMYEKEILPEFDAIVLAAGEQKIGFLNLEHHQPGLIANPETFETHRPGVFACGSLIRKQTMAVRTVQQGKDTARNVDRWLKGLKPQIIEWKFNSKFGKLKQVEFSEYLKESIPDPRHTPVKGDLPGFENDEAVAEAKRCLHCDCRKPESCKLRVYSFEYHVERKKFPAEDRNTIKKYFTHESIVYEPEKCIKCGLCVEIASSEPGLSGLAYIGRGFTVKIGIPFSTELGEALQKAASACAEACPTGAIALKIEEEYTLLK